MKTILISNLMILPLLASSITAVAGTLEYIEIDAITNVEGNYLPVELTAGTYKISPLESDKYAWSAWSTHEHNCENSNGCDRRVENRAGWLSSFAITGTNIENTIIDGAVVYPVLDLPENYHLFSYNWTPDDFSVIWVNNSFVHPTKSLANASAISIVLTLTEDTTLNFGFIDDKVYDNSGKLGLEIKEVPSPSSYILFSSALFALLGTTWTGNKSS